MSLWIAWTLLQPSQPTPLVQTSWLKLNKVPPQWLVFFPSFVRGLVFSGFSKDENSECENSILVFVRLLDHVCRTCMAPTTSAGWACYKFWHSTRPSAPPKQLIFDEVNVCHRGVHIATLSEVNIEKIHSDMGRSSLHLPFKPRPLHLRSCLSERLTLSCFRWDFRRKS